MIIKIENQEINFLDIFQTYIRRFSKLYSVKEYFQRFKIFKEEFRKLSYEDYYRKKDSINIPFFLDRSDDEFKKLLTDIKIDKIINTKKVFIEGFNTSYVPDEFDYSLTQAVQKVRSYESCSSCWAISIIESIEGQLYLKKKISLLLSVQQLIDCNNYGNCNGGYIIDALKYLIENRMLIQRNDDYPYDDIKGDCKYDSKRGVTKITNFSYFNINNINEDILKNILYLNGPLIITINASTWKYYIDGIYQPTSKSCNPLQSNHAVLLVGFGSENGINFWKIKNNWGDLWGENGYIRIIRGINACGILSNIYLTNIET